MKRVIAACAAMVVVHAIVAWWTPVQGDAWLHWIWAGRHPDAGIAGWLAAHATSADAFGYLLARCHLAHVILSPLVGVALVIGLFTVAMKRLPRGEDLLGLGLTSALIWIAQPHAGVAWFYTPSAAMHVYGATAAVWLLAPFRCGWSVPRGAWPLLVVLGYLAGTSTRATAVLALVLLVALAVRLRERGAWIAVTGLVAGTIVGFARPPLLELGKMFRRGIDQNMFVIKQPVEEIGKVIAVVAVLAAIELGRRCWSTTTRVADDLPATKDGIWGIVGYLGTSALCLFGPKYYEATTFPATCLLVATAMPLLSWFERHGYRLALIVFAVAVHLVAWGMALVSYQWIGAEGAQRFALLEAGAPGQRVTVPPYREILSSFYFAGEDFSTPRVRQQVALEVFGLREILVDPPYRRLEIDPGLDVVLEVDGPTPAGTPPMWSSVPLVAREQFAAFAALLPSGVNARLVVRNLRFAEAGNRPILLAWREGDELVNPKTLISPLDEENQYSLKMYGDLRKFDEAWIVHDGVATKTPYRNGSPRMRPATPTLHAVVVCNAARCLVEDALVPRF